MRAAMRAANPDIPLYEVRALDELVAERSAERRLAAQLIGVFATVALVLAAVGIYGVMSYAVAQRTQEIGIRMALGAGQENILQMVMRNGATLALAGVAIGLTAAFAAGAAHLLAAVPDERLRPADVLPGSAAAAGRGALRELPPGTAGGARRPDGRAALRMSPLRPFRLERYFARFEFTTRFLLASSDCEALSLAELLALADERDRAAWDGLKLGYTESPGLLGAP